MILGGTFRNIVLCWGSWDSGSQGPKGLQVPHEFPTKWLILAEESLSSVEPLDCLRFVGLVGKLNIRDTASIRQTWHWRKVVLKDNILNWLVVWNIFYFPIYWEFHHSN